MVKIKRFTVKLLIRAPKIRAKKFAPKIRAKIWSFQYLLSSAAVIGLDCFANIDFLQQIESIERNVTFQKWLTRHST